MSDWGRATVGPSDYRRALGRHPGAGAIGGMLSVAINTPKRAATSPEKRWMQHLSRTRASAGLRARYPRSPGIMVARAEREAHQVVDFGLIGGRPKEREATGSLGKTSCARIVSFALSLLVFEDPRSAGLRHCPDLRRSCGCCRCSRSSRRRDPT